MQLSQLVKHINATNISGFASQLPYGLFIVNKESKYAYSNPISLRDLGYKDPDACIGVNHHKLDIPSIALADVYTNYDREVVATGGVVEHFGRIYVANEVWVTGLVKRAPFYVNNQLAGVIISYHDVSKINAINYSLLNYKTEKNLVVSDGDKQFDYRIENYSSSLKLTVRESEVLFYTIRGKTAIEISGCLFISPRTVEKHIENLKRKLCVKNRVDLIDKAIAEGLASTLPKSLLKALC